MKFPTGTTAFSSRDGPGRAEGVDLGKNRERPDHGDGVGGGELRQTRL